MTDSEKLDLLLDKVGFTDTRLDSMDKRLNSMGTRLDSMDKRLESMDVRLGTVENNVTDIRLSLENETNRNLQLLAENHGNLIDKLNQAIKVSDKTALYEIQVNILKNKVEHLEKEVTEIKNKIA